MNRTYSESNDVHKTCKAYTVSCIPTSLLNLLCVFASIGKFYTEEANKQFSIILACKCEVRCIKTIVINNCFWLEMFLHAESNLCEWVWVCVCVCGCLCRQTQNYLWNTFRQSLSFLSDIVITIQTSQANYIPVKKNNQFCTQIKTSHRHHGLKTKTIIKSSGHGYYVFHLIKTCMKIWSDQLFYHLVIQRLLYYPQIIHYILTINFSVAFVTNSIRYSSKARMQIIN